MFDIILVDDGSGADFAPLFAIAQSNYACQSGVVRGLQIVLIVRGGFVQLFVSHQHSLL